MARPMATRPKKKRAYARYAEELPNKGIGANKQRFHIGGQEMATREEYETAKGQLGFKSGKGGFLTPGVQEAVSKEKAREIEVLGKRKLAEEELQAKIAEASLPGVTSEKAALIGQIGQPTIQTGPELQDLTIPANIKSAIPGFAVEATPTILGAAATGAAAGAIGGSVVPGVGTALGAVGGAVVGGVSGLLYKAISNVKAEAKEDTMATAVEFSEASKNIALIVSGINRGYLSAEEGLKLYQKQLTLIDRSERQLKELTKNNLNDFLSDGSTKMAEISAFNAPGGEREFWDLRIKAAILKPDPTAYFDTSSLGGS